MDEQLRKEGGDGKTDSDSPPVGALAANLLERFNPTGAALAADSFRTPDGGTAFAPLCRSKFKTGCRIRKGQGSPCKDCQAKDISPLTAELFAAHISAENGGPRYGIYPLLADTTTPWIALDFDNHSGDLDPRGDVQKILDVCESFEIPTALFSSSSGSGFHLYVFFDAPIRAEKARLLIGTIIERAGVKDIPEVFPKQDTHTGGKKGNLIALPFSGAAFSARGTTTQLDTASLNPMDSTLEGAIEYFIENVGVASERDVDGYLTLLGAITNKTAGTATGKHPNNSADYPPASFERVANNCAFMRHWKENAATLTEPEWYAGLGIVARCADGVTLAHEISKDYPGYSRIETDAKITHALEGAGPRTCATLRKEFPVCAGCPIASEGCVSPISLGHKPTAQELQLMVDLVLTSPDVAAKLKEVAVDKQWAMDLAYMKNSHEEMWDKFTKRLVGMDLEKELRAFKKSLKESVKAFAQKAREEAGEQKLRESQLPAIIANNRQLSAVVNEITSILTSENDRRPTLFAYGESYVVLDYDSSGRPILRPATENWVRLMCSQAASWFFKGRKGEVVDVSPPREVAQSIMVGRAAEIAEPLEAIVTSPLVLEDGTIADTPGYIKSHRCIYAPPAGFITPKMPEKPGQEDARRGASLLIDELLIDFPFVDKASKANMLSVFLTLAIRHLITGPTPLFCISAPAAGSGKTLLTELVSQVVRGSEASLGFDHGRAEEEWAKSIFSQLMAGANLVVIDNVDSRLKSVSLSAALTSTEISCRLLGHSRNIVVPNRTVFVTTGNNLSLGGDLPRRGVWVRLEPDESNPHLRTNFKHPQLLEWTKKHRSELLSSVLTMARAWILAGKPKPAKEIPRPGSFESWAVTVGGILEYAGVEGFLSGYAKDAQEADDEGVRWELFLEAIANDFRDREFTSVNLHQRIISSGEEVISLKETCPVDFHWNDDYEGGSTVKKLGHALKKMSGRRFGKRGLCLKHRIDKHAKRIVWRVESKYPRPEVVKKDEEDNTSMDEKRGRKVLEEREWAH